jgi:hypothetical protein
MYCHVVKQMLKDVSEVRAASIIALIMKAAHRPDDGGSTSP